MSENEEGMGEHRARRGFLTGVSVLEIPEIGVARFVDGKWQQGWYFGDELGLMLQLGALHMLG